MYLRPPQLSPAIRPSPSPTINNSPFITIAIKFDDRPEEIGWSVYSDKNEPISSKPVGSYSDSSYKNKLVTERVYVRVPGGDFDGYKNIHGIFFTLLDNGRNGLCCDSGQGFFQIFLGDISENMVVAKGSKFSRVQHFDISLQQVSKAFGS